MSGALSHSWLDCMCLFKGLIANYQTTPLNHSALDTATQLNVAEK